MITQGDPSNPKNVEGGIKMSHQKSDKRMNRREFLSFTNKAGVALIAASGALSFIQPPKIFSAQKGSGDKKLKEMKPIQNRAIVTSKSRNNKLIVSSKLTYKDQDYLLNSEGSFIWNLCNGRHGLNMVAEALSLKYKKAPSSVESDVNSFIRTLKSLHFIEFVN
jgi:hypothetical protein